MLTIDLKMDASYIKENMQIKWSAETGFVENVQKLVKEYKLTRNLIVSRILWISYDSLIYFFYIFFRPKLNSHSKFAFSDHQASENLQ